MNIEEIKELTENIFRDKVYGYNDYVITKDTFLRYNEIRDCITINRYSERLGRHIRCATISNLLIGTTFIMDVWTLKYYKIHDNEHRFTLDIGSEREIMEMSYIWYNESLKIHQLMIKSEERYKY